MIIRNYNNNDIESITKLGTILHDNYKFKIDIFSNCLVCDFNGTIVGFIVYSTIYERAEVIDIIVDENYRNHGFGTALINKFIDECITKNIDNITLEVNEKNKNAIKFYNNLGFNKISQRSNYYNNGRNDAYIMEKKLR